MDINEFAALVFAIAATSETSRRTLEAVQDPVIRTLAVASGTSEVARTRLFGRRGRNGVSP